MRSALISALLLACPAAAETPGEALFLGGRNATVTLAGSGAPLPATRFACAGCHGRDGTGRREGATEFPPVGWPALTDGDGPVYDDQSLSRAIAEGVDPAGRVLSPIMPRYRVDAEVMASLIGYLHLLGAAGDTAITPAALRFRASGEAAFDRGLVAALDRFNAEGGAFGRKAAVVAEGDAIDSGRLAGELAARIERSCLQWLLGAMRESGVSEVAVAGTLPPDLGYLAGNADVAIVPSAAALLLFPGADPGGISARRVFGCMDLIGPAASTLVARGNRLTVAVTEPEAVRWALDEGAGARGVAGFVAGRSLARAALASGRAVTAARLEDTFAQIRPSFELIVLAP